MEEVDRIAGAGQLVAVFGYWPSFHDAEVLWLRLDRQAQGDECYGPTLEALVHAFEMTSEVGADGYYVLRHHVLVHLRFRDVVELRLEGFNHQNALMGLTLTDLRERQMERVLWAVRFDSAFGVDASFQCYAVEVVSVVPCNKAGEPMPGGSIGTVARHGLRGPDMPRTVAELLEAALALPEAERAELAELLAATIPSPPSSLHPAWATELRRRAAEIDSGQVRAIPWDEVRRQVQAQLDVALAGPPNIAIL